MPGPSNFKKKHNTRAKHQKKPGNQPPLESQTCTYAYEPSSPLFRSSLSRSPSRLLTSPIQNNATLPLDNDVGYYHQELVPQIPFIYDPGNGPRVRDTRAFLASSYFSQPPALDIPLCAEFAQEEVLQMLCTVLPEETALILWYNKSRATSRICPACQRLYRLGDVLPDHIDDEHERIYKHPSTQLEREQELSGLCSPVCFILASFNYPGAIKSAWGRMSDDMDDRAWSLLNGPGEGNIPGDLSLGLGMLVKMTRLHDLGLAQLCFGDDAVV